MPGFSYPVTYIDRIIDIMACVSFPLFHLFLILAVIVGACLLFSKNEQRKKKLKKSFKVIAFLFILSSLAFHAVCIYSSCFAKLY